MKAYAERAERHSWDGVQEPMAAGAHALSSLQSMRKT